jgi:hypothetical protein
MTKVEPARDRCSISKEMGEVKIVIPARKNIFLLAFTGFWLCGWAAGELMVSAQLLKGTSADLGATLILVAWLGAWTVCGGFAIYAWLWNLCGKEVVTASRHSLEISREIFRFRRPREFDGKSIGDLRVSPTPFNPWDFKSGMQFCGLPGSGPIAFDYGAKTYRFGAGLDEAEAKKLVVAITDGLRAG